MTSPLRALRHKLTARIILLFVGIASALEIAHALGMLQMIPFSEVHVTDAILVATFILSFLLYETFEENEGELKQLLYQFDATASVSRFADQYQFHSHWKHMRQTYSSFTVVGTPPEVFLDQFARLAKDSKKCKLCLGIDLSAQTLARNFLTLGTTAVASHFDLHEFSFPPSGCWIIGNDGNGTGVEAILCFPSSNEGAVHGLYLRGSAANAFVGCVSPLLVSRNVGGETVGPIRIYSDRQIDTVLDKKSAFHQEMLDVENGLRLDGTDKVCDNMMAQLEQTTKCLDVTHICNEQTMPLLSSEVFTTWLQANYAAIGRGVKITRIFLVPRALRKNPDLLRVIAEMQDKHLTVMLCDWEGLENHLREDFSLYDDQHVIYISHEGGGWFEDPKARISDSLERVKHFRGIFEAIRQRAK